MADDVIAMLEQAVGLDRHLGLEMLALNPGVCERCREHRLLRLYVRTTEKGVLETWCVGCVEILRLRQGRWRTGTDATQAPEAPISPWRSDTNGQRNPTLR